jgi:hypothetical protein
LKIKGPALIIFLAVPLFAQESPAPAAAEPAPAPEYGGPAILTRGAAASLRAPENTRLRPYLSITGAYDSGITPVIVNSNGEVPSVASAGVDAEIGLLGYQRWKRSSLGLDYRGNYRHYVKDTFFNGTNQILGLVYTKQATRRLEFTLRESAGLISSGFFEGQQSALIDPSFSNTPNNEIFDGRTMYLDTMGDLTYRKTARLSFNIGGDGFLSRRRSSALYGVTGYRARGDVAYRTSRFATTGVAYNFTHFEFTKGFGASDIHTVALAQSFRFGRSWELGMKIGGSRVETLGLIAVAVDPVITAITGQSQTVEAVYRINWVPALEGTLTRTFRRSSLSFAYARGVTAGNGVYLTSRQETANAGFTYTGIHKWNLGLSGGYASYASLSRQLKNYASYNGGGGATYNVTGSLHIIARYDYRHQAVSQNVFERETHRASIGFGFAPGDLPLSLW